MSREFEVVVDGKVVMKTCDDVMAFGKVKNLRLKGKRAELFERVKWEECEMVVGAELAGVVEEASEWPEMP